MPPPGPSAHDRQRHEEHERHPGLEAGPGDRDDLAVPDPAEGQCGERRGQRALAGQPRTPGARGVGRPRSARAAVRRPPRARWRRPAGRSARASAAVRRASAKASTTTAVTSPALALRLPERCEQPDLRRRPALLAPAPGSGDQPRQDGVPDQHRPVPDHQPLDDERVPDHQRDRDEPRERDARTGADQPRRTDAGGDQDSRRASASGGAAPGSPRRGPRRPRPTAPRAAARCERPRKSPRNARSGTHTRS